MAVTAKWYGKAILAILNKEVDWAADTIKVALCTSSYTPDQDAHDYFDDISNEVGESGTGYTAGGATLGSASIGYTADGNVIKLDGADVTWPAATITARYAIIYDATPGSAATNPLLMFIDFGENKVSTAGDFKITWHEDGIATITVS